MSRLQDSFNHANAASIAAIVEPTQPAPALPINPVKGYDLRLHRMTDTQQETVRQYHDELKEQDQLVMGALKNIEDHDIFGRSSYVGQPIFGEPAHITEWLAMRRGKQENNTALPNALCPFLRLPATEPYHRQVQELRASRQGTGIVGQLAALPHLQDALDIKQQKDHVTDVYLWGGEGGELTRRLTVYHPKDNKSSKGFCIDETFTDGQRRHYAVYTMKGRLVQEVYITPGADDEVIRPGLLGRVAGALGLDGLPEEDQRLSDLRRGNALHGLKALLKDADPDVAQSAVHACLSVRAMLAGDVDAKAAYDKALADAIRPEYAQRVDVAQKIAAAYNELDAALRDVAKTRDDMADLPAAQEALDTIMADMVEARDQHKGAIADARHLLDADDARPPQVAKLTQDIDAQLRTLYQRPEMYDLAMRELDTWRQNLAARDTGLGAMVEAQSALTRLSQQTQAHVHDYMSDVRDQAAKAARYLEYKNSDLVPGAGLLKPVEDALPVASKRNNDGVPGKKA